MAAVIDMSNFEFCGRVIQAVSELIFDDTVRGPEFTDIHTIYPDIVTRTQIGFIGEGGLVGVANQGCNPTPQDWNVATRVLDWQPKDWEILIAMCWKDLEDTAAAYSLQTGIDMPYFTDSDYMAILLQVLNKSVLDFMWRLAWFNDTAAQNVSAGGNITNGISVDYFTIIDGLWKQVDLQVTANPPQRGATITENTGATYAAQALDPTNVLGYLEGVYSAAPLELRQQTDQFILVTQSVYDAYRQYLTTECCLESARMGLLNGYEALSFAGVPVVAVPQWDIMIRRYEDTGAKWNNPHRILYTSKRVIGFGVDRMDSFERVRIWNNYDTREVKVEIMGKSDAKLTNPPMFALGI